MPTRECDRRKRARGAAAKNATTAVPIVFMTGSDPVKDGLVASLNRPGGNVTGVSFVSGALATKRLEILRQLTPNAATIAMLVQLDFDESVLEQRDVQAAARATGQHLIVFDVNSAADIESAFATMAARGAGALYVGTGPFTTSHRELLTGLAARNAIPAMYSLREFVVAGGLMSYGASITDCLSPNWYLRRPNSQGREAIRPAGHAVRQI